jgi:hypothetical protein
VRGGVSASRDFEPAHPRQPVPARSRARLLPRDALRVVGDDPEPPVPGTRVLRRLVRAARPEDPRRHHRPGGRVPHQRRGLGIRRGQDRRDVHPHRRGRGPQAGRAALSHLQHLRHREPRPVARAHGAGPGRVRARAFRSQRLRLRLPQSCAAGEEQARDGDRRPSTTTISS